MVEEKTCRVCGGPYWEMIADQGIDIHNQGDCIEYLKQRILHVRAEITRELDKKYNSFCEKKVNSVVDHYEKKLAEAYASNGNARTKRLEEIAKAVSYCLRHGHIAQSAVRFTGLDKQLAEI